MTKQEKIQEAYGEYWEKVKDYVCENGWCSGFWGETFEKLDGYTEPKSEGTRWRPKSLKGIETNNGWTILKGIKNEIQVEGDIWILNKHGEIELWIEGIFLPVGYATHFRPITKPQPPIY
jgi:hypothetical protein